MMHLAKECGGGCGVRRWWLVQGKELQPRSKETLQPWRMGESENLLGRSGV
jgi:hypothetical protein